MEDQNRTSGVLIGESYVGEGAEAAHINTVLGDRDKRRMAPTSLTSPALTALTRANNSSSCT